MQTFKQTKNTRNNRVKFLNLSSLAKIHKIECALIRAHIIYNMEMLQRKLAESELKRAEAVKQLKALSVSKIYIRHC